MLRQRDNKHDTINPISTQQDVQKKSSAFFSILTLASFGSSALNVLVKSVTACKKYLPNISTVLNYGSIAAALNVTNEKKDISSYSISTLMTLGLSIQSLYAIKSSLNSRNEKANSPNKSYFDVAWDKSQKAFGFFKSLLKDNNVDLRKLIADRQSAIQYLENKILLETIRINNLENKAEVEKAILDGIINPGHIDQSVFNNDFNYSDISYVSDTSQFMQNLNKLSREELEKEFKKTDNRFKKLVKDMWEIIDRGKIAVEGRSLIIEEIVVRNNEIEQKIAKLKMQQ